MCDASDAVGLSPLSEEGLVRLRQTYESERDRIDREIAAVNEQIRQRREQPANGGKDDDERVQSG